MRYAILFLLAVGVVEAQVKPFRFTINVTQTSNGEAKDGQYYVSRRGSDGATLYRRDGENQLTLPAKGISLDSFDGLNEVSTLGLGRPYHVVDNTNCKGEGLVSGDTKDILGHRSQHFHVENILGESQKVVQDSWLSLDVDCRMLAGDIFHYDDYGILTGTDHAEAVSVILEEPPASDFVVPAGKEVSASVLHSDAAALKGKTVSAKTLDRLSRQYAYEKSVREGAVPYPTGTVIIKEQGKK